MQLSNLLSTFEYGENTVDDSSTDGLYGHDEADITIISHVLQAASDVDKVFRVLSDDTERLSCTLYSNVNVTQRNNTFGQTETEEEEVDEHEQVDELNNEQM